MTPKARAAYSQSPELRRVYRRVWLVGSPSIVISLFATFYSIGKLLYYQELSAWMSDTRVWVAWGIALSCMLIELTLTIQLLRAVPNGHREQ